MGGPILSPSHSPRRPFVPYVPSWCAVMVLLLSACGRPDPMTDAQLDSTFAAYAEPGAPGAAVLIVNDTSVRIRTWGLADLDGNVPVTASSDFRLASLTSGWRIFPPT